MELIVERYSEQDREAWNAFVEDCPDGTFFHFAEWREVIHDSFGHAPHYLLARANGEVRGVLPLFHVKSTLFGNSLSSAPFCVYGGALGSADVIEVLEDEAAQLAGELGVDHLEMRNRERVREGWPEKELYVTFRKAIADDDEENLKAIPRKQRAMVRKGIKKGLVSEIESHIEAFLSDLCNERS